VDRLRILAISGLFLLLFLLSGNRVSLVHAWPAGDPQAHATITVGAVGFSTDIQQSKIISPCPSGDPYGTWYICDLHYGTYSISPSDNGDGSVYLYCKIDPLREDASISGGCAVKLSLELASGSVLTGVAMYFGFPVTVSTGGSGSGTIRVAKCFGSVSSCLPIDPMILYDYPNHSVYLNVIAAPGSVFTHWTGDCPNGVCPWGAPRSATANFSLLGTLAVSKTGSGSGTVTSSPSGIDCGSTCSASFSNKTPVTLTVVADAGSVFIGWSGACSGTGTCKLTIPLSTDVSVAANFVSLGCSGLTVELSPTEVWPDKTGVDGVPTNSLVTAKVSNPAPSGGCEVKFEVQPTLSKGHDHGTHLMDKAGKLSTDSCTIVEGSTFCTTVYNAPEISGEEKITAILMAGTQVKETKDATMRVRVPELSPLPASGQYLLAGSFGEPGVTSQHTDNHNGTATTLTLLQAMAFDYFGVTGQRLCVNDLSLPWGGLFDIGNNWAPPHGWHRVGKSVDFNTHAECFSATPPPVDPNVLKEAANKWGATRYPEGGLIHYEFP